MVESLVVIVDRDGEHLFGVILTDHVVVENFAYLIGGRHAVARLHQRGFILLADNVHAKFDALLADKHGRAGDELAHLVLALAAKRAVERILGIASADLAHLSNADQIQVITAVTPQAKHRLTHDREGQPRPGAKGGSASASSIIEEASENP
jgi:hypothetical protein